MDRRERLAALRVETRTSILFVSPHQLIEDLSGLAEIAPDRPLCIARELTKIFEEVQWTTPALAAEEWATRHIQGEFTLVLAGGKPVEPDLEASVEAVLAEMAGGIQMSEAVRTVAARSGILRRALYEEVLSRNRGTSP